MWRPDVAGPDIDGPSQLTFTYVKYGNGKKEGRKTKKWIGHVMRNETLLKDILEERIKRKKRSGKPQRRTLDV